MKKVFLLLWWLITFRGYKVEVCRIYEIEGMLFYYAILEAKKMKKTDCLKFIESYNKGDLFRNLKN